MKLLFKLKRLLGFNVDMIVICYIKNLNLISRQEYEQTVIDLRKLYKTERVLLLENDYTKIDIQYF